MRHTRAHTANRRSHHALSGQSLSVCAKCGTKTMPHKVCLTCGTYKGREVVNVLGKTLKKEKKKKQKADGK